MNVSTVNIRNVFKVIALRRLALRADLAACLPATRLNDPFHWWQIKFVFFKSLTHQVLVAEENNKVVGMIRVYINTKNRSHFTGSIFSLYVHPDHRKKGVAALLMQKALSFFEDWGISHVELFVLHTQEAAIMFYKKNGFVVTGTDFCAFANGNNLYNKIFMAKTTVGIHS